MTNLRPADENASSGRLRPIKRLGQNFLIDPNTIRKIVAALDAPDDALVLEIGPGPGALTCRLAEQHANLVAVEVDERAVLQLREKLPAVDVRHEDILETDLSMLNNDGRVPLWIIGNLPYNITSQILFKILDASGVRRAVLTMQKEVAERLVAVPHTKAYGILSVLTQLSCNPTVCFNISPNVFRPKPAVWSSTVRLDWPPATPIRPDVAAEDVRRVVRTAFNQRRKTLRNSLRMLVQDTGSAVPEQWASLRAEALNPVEFVEMTAAIMDARA